MKTLNTHTEKYTLTPESSALCLEKSKYLTQQGTSSCKTIAQGRGGRSYVGLILKPSRASLAQGQVS